MKNPLSALLNCLVITCAALLLSACHHYHALDATKKAKMVSELMSGSDDCAGFKKELTSPAMDDDAIDGVYQKAMNAGCVKKDI